jgi:hypothetical protein
VHQLDGAPANAFAGKHSSDMQTFNKIRPNRASLQERRRALAILLSLLLLVIIGIPVISYITGGEPAPLPEIEPAQGWSTELRVNSDGKVRAIETLAVVSEGKALKHGVIRAFETMRQNEFGVVFPLSYQVETVRRNGIDIPWSSTKPAEHVQLVYLGDDKVKLEPGEYNFFFQYSISNLVQKVGEHAVLSQELTPLWPVRVDKAVTEVKLPKFVAQDSVSIAARIVDSREGPYGKRVEPGQIDSHVRTSFFDAGKLDLSARDVLGVRFEVQRPLLAYERLHVTIWWPEAFMKWPAQEQKPASN